jgi:hypothetical protein
VAGGETSGDEPRDVGVGGKAELEGGMSQFAGLSTSLFALL